MGDLKSELERVSKGPIITRDARPDEAAAVKKSKKPDRKKREQKTMKPVALQQLIDMYSVTEVAEMVGISTSGVSSAIARDIVLSPVELLAGMILHNEGKVVHANTHKIMLVRVPKKDIDVFRRVNESLGYTVKDVGLE